ncbi:homeobox-leucine zipper protein HAT5-like [Solanum tuberosum]|uniref:Homeobox-leucine zipper protein n=1 Tax=Solanum tuberosum TaxID=4113 RepID=M0ZSV7_SOLTU|nr:PREDICTED: homeobox-leucine zipper protein HAT5-like [Solanum tuberosum]
MEVARVYEGSNNCFIPPNEILPPTSNWVSNSSSIFHGSVSMVNFDQDQVQKSKMRSFLVQLDQDDNNSNDDNYNYHQSEKKRRLLPKQVEFLEKSFEVENKLEPERKVQLAKETGLQPRQVAIWFQNRRARCKTKQLEKNYDVLKASFDKLKTQYDCLFKENESLRNEVHLLKDKLINSVKGKETSEPINPLDHVEPQNPSIGVASNLAMVVCKQEDTKSDVLDSDSPRFTDGDYTSFLEPADSSNVFQTEHSDFSQENDTLCFPKLEEDHHHDDLPVNSCHLGFQIEDQSWFSHY